MKPYQSPAYASNRLLNTIVRGPDGLPLKIMAIADKRVAGNRLIDGHAVEFKYSEMDINPVPLGYCNSRSRAVYMSRIPKRQDWKQGLRHENCRAIADMVESHDGDHQPLIDFPRWDVIAKTIQGEYPSIEDAVKAVSSKKVVSWAFSRHFSVDLDFFLHYKGIFKIGTIDPQNPRKFQLKDQFWWAKETLEESLA